ncbi:hypothetical protein B0H12DRAFT_1098789 [Mycena haematopus]|nr:hypothetical protein B0H12DRAFT_1098789 [Mycena haematopus]
MARGRCGRHSAEPGSPTLALVAGVGEYERPPDVAGDDVDDTQPNPAFRRLRSSQVLGSTSGVLVLCYVSSGPRYTGGQDWRLGEPHHLATFRAGGSCIRVSPALRHVFCCGWFPPSSFSGFFLCGARLRACRVIFGPLRFPCENCCVAPGSVHVVQCRVCMRIGRTQRGCREGTGSIEVQV